MSKPQLYIPAVAGEDTASLIRWARHAAGTMNEFMRRMATGAFFVWDEGCKNVPTNTNIDGAEELIFESPFTGNGTLIVTGVGFEGDVHVALNGTDLGTLSDPDTSSEILYEVAVTNLIDGLNSFKIWSTSADTGELRRLEAWRNFTKEQLSSAGTTADWGSVTGTGKPDDNADVTSDNPQPWGWVTDDGFQPDDLADVTTEHAAEVIFEASSLPASPEPGWLVYLTSADGGFSADTWVRRNDANTAWIKVGAHDALELINGPNESGADQTANQFAQALSDIDTAVANAVTNGAVAGANVNDWNDYPTLSGTDKRVGIRIDRANNRVIVGLLNADDSANGVTYDVELEVYGASITSTNTADDTGEWSGAGDTISVNGQVVSISGAHDSGNDAYTVNLSTLTRVAFRFHITTYDDATISTWNVSLGDRIVSSSDPVTDPPWEVYFTPDDSADYDVLLMTNSPAAAGADVTAPKVGVRKNKDGLTTTEAYSGFIHGFDSAGNPADTDAQFEVDGQLVSLSRAQFTSGATYKMGDNGGEQQGFIIWDTTNSDPFSVQGESVSVAFAKYFGGTSGWFYSGGANGFNGDGVSFTPTDDMVAIGTTRSRNGAGGITQASLFSSPLVVQGLFSDGADVTGDHNSAGVLGTAQTFTPSWDGFSTDPSGDISYLDLGDVVIMWTNSALVGTANTSAMSINNIPSAIEPSSVRWVSCLLVLNDGTSQFTAAGAARFTASSTGELDFRTMSPEPNSDWIETLQNKPSSGDKGLPAGWMIMYTK